MPIILTNVDQFRETLSRRRTFTRGQFDTLVCVFIGPTSLKDQFLPSVDSQSTAVGLPYPFMLATTVSDVDQAGAITEVTITYRGRMIVNGNTSPPVVSMRQVETSGSYQIPGSVIVNPGVEQYGSRGVIGPGGSGIETYPKGAVGVVTKVGTWTVNSRYLSKQAIIKYQSLNRLNTPIQLSLAQPIAGYTILSEDRAPLSGQNQVDGKPAINLTVRFSFNLMCSDFSCDQVAATLYDCSETWEYKWVGSVNWGLTT